MLSLKTIVVPIDFSERSLKALPYAASMAQAFGAKLKVIFVNEPGLRVSDFAWVGVPESAWNEEHARKSQESMKKIVEQMVPALVDVETEVLNGRAAETIKDYGEVGDLATGR